MGSGACSQEAIGVVPDVAGVGSFGVSDDAVWPEVALVTVASCATTSPMGTTARKEVALAYKPALSSCADGIQLELAMTRTIQRDIVPALTRGSPHKALNLRIVLLVGGRRDL